MFRKKKFYGNKSESFYKSLEDQFIQLTIEKGELFSNKNIKLLRPSNGLGPEYFKKLINKKSPLNMPAETALKKSILKKLKIKKQI